jgi:hypothetical protein
MGFPTGQRYKGTAEQNEYLERQYLRKAEFMTQNGTATWNGEFGPVYADPRVDEDAETINQERYSLLGQQLNIYDKYNIHWSIWLYKDIGLQGMIYTNPDSPWNKTIQPVLEKKHRLWLDNWGRRPSKEPEAVLAPMVQWIDKVCPQAKETYPTPWMTERHLLRNVFQTFLANSFVDEFAELFRGMDHAQLEALARSFHFDQCVQREGLNEILRQHAKN